MLMSSLSRYAAVHTHDHLLFLTLYLIDSLLQIFLLSHHLCDLCAYILCDRLNGPPVILSVTYIWAPTIDLVSDFDSELLQLSEYLDPVVSLDPPDLVLHGPETLNHLSPLLLLHLDLALQHIHMMPQLLLLSLWLSELSHLVLHHTLLSLVLALQQLYWTL